MSRQINFNDPDTWTDEDKDFLRARGYDHESLKVENQPPVFAPAATAQTVELEQLKTFLETHFPGEIGVEGESPVGTAMRLLGNSEGYIDSAETGGDEYEEWKLAELREEAANRDGMEDQSKAKKPEIIAALRAWDAEHPDQLEA